MLISYAIKLDNVLYSIIVFGVHERQHLQIIKIGQCFACFCGRFEKPQKYEL
jgi:hypothetical protein